MKYRLCIGLLVSFFATASLAGELIKLPDGIIRLDAYPAPALQVNDIDGVAYDLQDDKGALVFVHFWASWCGPCREEMPAIQRMAKRLEPEGIKIALINTAEDEDTVFSFLATLAPDIRALMDVDGQVTEAWKPRGLPATYLVDQQGQVRYQALGGRPWDEAVYLDFLRTLMTEQPVR
ncbi:MAG: TlpA family protein disulfide reductase [Gammaproteobacteria bacterium]|nr:TlpA family protein disulfide reductase [Gammaproteobacteria bacterium]MBU2479046.1 TlpA family protein disulfide reductase [Gammaproteobacteria bacterium]